MAIKGEWTSFFHISRAAQSDEAERLPALATMQPNAAASTTVAARADDAEQVAIDEISTSCSQPQT